MEETKQLTDNELIAAFMGIDWENATFQWRPGASRNMTIEDLDNYRTNWSWLMPVVEKIEKTDYGFISRVTGCQIEGYLCDFVDHENTEIACQFSQTDKIDAVYKAVVEFIKWYSNQPQKA